MKITKATDYNYGFYIGKRFRHLFKILLNLDIKNKIQKNIGISIMKEYYPQWLERLRGLAASLGTNIEGLRAISIYLSKAIMRGCTASFCAPPATRDGEVYLCWNIDFFEAAEIIGRFFTFYISEIPGYNRYVAFGIPCLFGVPLLNEFGLSCVGAAVGMKDGGGRGLMDTEISNLCMESCRDVSDVLNVYKNVKLYSFPGITGGMLLNLNFIWGDAEGNGVAIEHSSNYIHYEHARDGILAIANHHQFLDKRLTGSPTPDELPAISGSYCRVGRMWKLLRENKGRIDLSILKNIMADHHLEAEHIKDYNYKGPIDDGTICVHYWNIPRYLKERRFKKAIEAYFMGKTIGSVIIQPKRLIINSCSGNPCNRPYKTIYFRPIFEGKGYPSLSIKVATKLNTRVLKSPGIRNLKNFIFKQFFKRWLIITGTILEKLTPMERKRPDKSLTNCQK